MSPREVISATGPRRSRVTPCQGRWRIAYSGHGLAGSLVMLDEADAHRAARAWERAGVVPRGPETLIGLQPVGDEQLEAWRFDAAVSELHAADLADIGAPDRRRLPAPDGWE